MIFAAFATAATLTICLVIHELRSWWRYPNRPDSYATYRRNQLTDTASATFCVALVAIHIERSPLWGIVTCAAALASMVGACLKQYRERCRLSELI
jgi:hypothetical protein